MLITLLVFMTIAIIVITATISIVASNTVGASVAQQGLVARDIAENGIEESLLRLLRDPLFTGGTIPVGNGNAQIIITSNGQNKIIQSTGTVGDFQRKITVSITYNNYVIKIISWQDD